jgi:hypothetical protein
MKKLSKEEGNLIEEELKKIRKTEGELSKKIFESMKDAMDITKHPSRLSDIKFNKKVA